MSDRSEWVTLVDENNTVVGEVAPEVAVLLFGWGLGDVFFDGSSRMQLTVACPTPSPSSFPVVETPSSFPVVERKFTGESAAAEIAELNPDGKVRLGRVLVGAGTFPAPQSDTGTFFTSLDGWLMAVHEAKQAGHRLTCFTAPKERVAVVLDYDVDKSYSLPLRYLHTTPHGVQFSTVKAWGFEHDPLEFLRQVRDHNLRGYLIAGKPCYLNPENEVDAQPDVELEALWKDDAEEVLAAFDAHTENMKKQPAAARERWSTPEARAEHFERLKNSAPWDGKHPSDEHRQAISEGGEDKKHTLPENDVDAQPM
jgi:hypothetical protein